MEVKSWDDLKTLHLWLQKPGSFQLYPMKTWTSPISDGIGSSNPVTPPNGSTAGSEDGSEDRPGSSRQKDGKLCASLRIRGGAAISLLWGLVVSLPAIASGQVSIGKTLTPKSPPTWLLPHWWVDGKLDDFISLECVCEIKSHLNDEFIVVFQLMSFEGLIWSWSIFTAS